MASKHWSDRADKDLFFTILSVKNIGIISGGEWSTIGNHMRSLGYGFTNEGCRQHFQGLRRAQSKAEAEGTVPFVANAYHFDPTMNPITRRPGPGRGRPKKPSSLTASEPRIVQAPIGDNPSASVISTPGTTQSVTPTPDQQGQLAAGEAIMGHGPPSQHHASLAQMPVSSPAVTAGAVAGPSRVHDHGHEKRDGDGDGDGSVGEDAEGEGVDGPPSKRPRVDQTPDLDQSAPLDDEAVLALAAHSGAPGPDFHGRYAAVSRTATSELPVLTMVNSFPYGET
ncbi:hypothetical protein E4U53_006640 [Claviceps sorghi]|nr:hypothetical protein E4U53_006640 [Claviceps sorghi]